jgi:hypothetical protein
MDHSLSLSLSLDQDDPLLHVKSWKVLLFKAAAAAGSTTSVSAAALLHISESSSSSSSSSSYLHPNLSTKFTTESIHTERGRQRT